MSVKRLNAAGMEAVMREYYDGCNEADGGKDNGVFHARCGALFSAGHVRGAVPRRRKDCRTLVRSRGKRRFLLDTLMPCLIDADKAEAVIEWSHFKTGQGTVLRGAEWVVFDRASGLMQEIRAYYASPQAADLKRLELGGFDYVGRGYEMVSPRGRSAGQ